MGALTSGPGTPSISAFNFSFAEFEAWYRNLTDTRLEPARVTLERLLNEILDAGLSDLDRYRIRVASSRVKQPTRLWAKMHKDKYADSTLELDDIPLIIDDLVGIRITCNNNCDVRTLQALLANIPAIDQEAHMPICTDPDSEKNYLDDPKKSGYRAYHINLQTSLQTPAGWTLVRGELQARTLLQDGWGELTHEDTYKPGQSLPPLAERLARRMADILSAVDDLAQDLRDELDRQAQEAVGDALIPAVALNQELEPHEEPLHEDEMRSALITETKRVVGLLTKSATLAEVAQRVQANFGREASINWGGFDSFATLVRTAVPTARIISHPPGLLIPPGVTTPTWSESDPTQSTPPEDIPALISRLKDFDRNIPACGSDKLRDLMQSVVSTLSSEVWNKLDIEGDSIGIREVNRLSKHARDTAAASGIQLGRQAIDYILKALLFTNRLSRDLPRSSLDEILISAIYERASRLGLIDNPEDDRAELVQWFNDAR